MDNMKGFGMMIQELKKNPKTIVFTEGSPLFADAVRASLKHGKVCPETIGRLN